MQQQSGIALCLSGGGFRAALFHLGSLRRLNELGVLSQVDVISAVSGGSMLAAHLASHIRQAEILGISWPEPGRAWPAFEIMAAKFHTKLSKPLPIATVLSFNEVMMRNLPRGIRNWVGPMKLCELPLRPEFVFNATEMNTGRLWSFSRERVGSDQFGFSHKYGGALVAEAVAASACFPLFNQLQACLNSQDFDSGKVSARPEEIEILFADGGVFDNLGLESVTSARTLLVSNGGKGARPLPEPGADKAQLSAPQMTAPARNQLEALRWILGTESRDSRVPQARLEQLSRRLAANEIQGAYWSIGDGIDTGSIGLTDGYRQAVASELIATIRTQLDAFSDSERHILENHGYLMTEASIRTHASQLVKVPAPVCIPWRDALSEAYVRSNLRNSANISSGLRALKRLFSS